jgi:hypothetical protein
MAADTGTDPPTANFRVFCIHIAIQNEHAEIGGRDPAPDQIQAPNRLEKVLEKEAARRINGQRHRIRNLL